MMTSTDTVAPVVRAMKPGRRIAGMSAVLLPFASGGAIDWGGFESLLARTWDAGLTPAVNMDTGYVHLLTDEERERVLETSERVGGGRPFVAGAFIEGRDEQPVLAYHLEIDRIRRRGGQPILFQCSAIARADEADALRIYQDVATAGGPLLGFELGTMFAPFGRIFSVDGFRRLMAIPAFTGLKHSSLDRELEWQRLDARDADRPEFAVYTGNDLAIDMVFYGSDYLLGLSAFAVEAFALRDRLWAEGDSRAITVNDLLQYLGQIAFRAPVPAYRHSAAQFLRLRGVIGSSEPHPKSPRRPDSDVALLDDIRTRLDGLMGAHPEAR